MAILELSNIIYTQENRNIIDDISFSVHENDFIKIVGPSGSGKSTMFKLCSDLINPTSGILFYKDLPFSNYEPSALRKKIAYCFQTPYLFGSTVMDNMCFPFTIRGEKPDMLRIMKLLQQLNLDEFCLKQNNQCLSGGEKQRVALARSMLFRPDILLLDEVTSALDHDNVILMELAIKSFYDEGTTILWITHNLEQSKRHANRIINMEMGKVSFDDNGNGTIDENAGSYKEDIS